MSLLQPVYRMTIYEADSDTTPLSPAAGAPHSDDFKVISSGSVGGTFQPYIATMPVGLKNSFDPVSKKLTIGAIRLTLGDPKLNSGNLNRWVTAFIGDDSGANKLKGLRAFVEESTDAGVTFSPFYVGDIQEFKLQNLVEWRIVIREDTNIQKSIKLFAGEPSASLMTGDGAYANRHQMMPWGPDSSADIGYGALEALPLVLGTWRTSESPRNRVIEIDKDSTINQAPGVIHISKPLLSQVSEVDDDDARQHETEGRTGPIVRVIQGATVGRFYLTYLEVFITSDQVRGRYPISVERVLLEPIESGTFEYQPLSAFANDSTVRFQILSTEPPTEEFPLLVSNVHPMQFLQDIAQGKWSFLNPSDGTALFEDRIDIDTDTFNTFINDRQFKNSRWLIKGPVEMKKFVNGFLQAYNMGYRMEATESAGRAFSKMVPFSMDLPTTIVGVPTITTEEVRPAGPIAWTPGQNFLRFDMTYYEERITGLDDIRGVGEEDQSPFEGPKNPSLIEEFPITDQFLELGNLFGGDGVFAQDARGLRFFPGELFIDFEFQNGFDINFTRQRMVRRLANKLQRENEFRFSRGPATIALECERTGSTNDLQLGQYRILDVDYLPDPFTHVRGGARLVQCIERSENGPTINFKFADSGQNVQRSTPVVNAFSQIGTTNTASGSIQVLNREQVETWFAVTAQSAAAAPAETSSLWEYANSVIIPAGATQSVVIGELPEGSRVWVRARARVPADEDLQLPSDFAFPSPGFFDMGTALSAPTNLRVFNVTSTNATLAWQNTEASSSIEVKLKPDSSGSFKRVVTLRRRSRKWILRGLSTAASENPYVASVGYVDRGTGATSATASISFSTVAEVLKPCPTPGPVLFNNDGISIVPLF